VNENEVVTVLHFCSWVIGDKPRDADHTVDLQQHRLSVIFFCPTWNDSFHVGEKNITDNLCCIVVAAVVCE